jgi:GTP-binding protein Era
MSDSEKRLLDGDEGAMLPSEEELPEGHRSGFVAVVGQPNVGKSTLMNKLVGQKIAITTAKPQTTRRRIRGFLTRPDAQIIFVDTPGIHQPQDKLGEYMVEWAEEAIPNADLVLFLVDGSRAPNELDQRIAATIGRSGVGALLVVNKVDQVKASVATERLAAYKALGTWQGAAVISASEGRHLDKLLATIIGALPEGPRFYPPDELSDQHEREIVAELIREQALQQLGQEVPHALDVQVDEFKERENGLMYISANVIVERDTHKSIFIGAQGQKLKSIGAAARREIERFLGSKVYLDLWVKVRPKWRNDEKALKRWGYMPPREKG